MEKIIKDRVTFLAEQFDIFENRPNTDDLIKKIKSYEGIGYEVKSIRDISNNVIALISTKKANNNRLSKKISVSIDIFSNMIAADPTENKMYLQWMLNVYTKFLKSDDQLDIENAIRFASEDLPQANVYLTLFEDNKRKKKFKELCLSSYSLKNISDPTNINQYKSLAQLFDAVDPFIEREPSAVERTINKFVENGQAEIPVKDRKFTLFIPKTTEANVVFDKFANWCTAKNKNGMFKNYTQNHRKPNGKYSDIYIIINNKFFENQSDEMYQIHFETSQLKDRTNSSNKKIYESVISQSEGIANFFHDELIEMAKQYKGGIESNKYLDFLIEFGFTESLFELFEEDTPYIKIINSRNIPKLPNMNRFKNLDELTIIGAGLHELHPSVCLLPKMRFMSLSNNKLRALPAEIGDMKELVFLNISGNKIKDIPTEISRLDKSNGGKLHRIGVTVDDVGEKNINKLRSLLPQTLIN
jgi:hypothetical protein